MYQRIICILADPNMQGIKIKHPKMGAFFADAVHDEKLLLHKTAM